MRSRREISYLHRIRARTHQGHIRRHRSRVHYFGLVSYAIHLTSDNTGARLEESPLTSRHRIRKCHNYLHSRRAGILSIRIRYRQGVPDRSDPWNWD